MGRNKIPIKSIENDRQKNITFSRRKAGLLKKAHELSVLCETKVAVLIFSPKDECHVVSLFLSHLKYSSASNSDDILMKYYDSLKSQGHHFNLYPSSAASPSTASIVSPMSASSPKTPVIAQYKVEALSERSEDQKIKLDTSSTSSSSAPVLSGGRVPISGRYLQPYPSNASYFLDQQQQFNIPAYVPVPSYESVTGQGMQLPYYPSQYSSYIPPTVSNSSVSTNTFGQTSNSLTAQNDAEQLDYQQPFYFSK
jgi:hypothetical protein